MPPLASIAPIRAGSSLFTNFACQLIGSCGMKRAKGTRQLFHLQVLGEFAAVVSKLSSMQRKDVVRLCAMFSLCRNIVCRGISTTFDSPSCNKDVHVLHGNFSRVTHSATKAVIPQTLNIGFVLRQYKTGNLTTHLQPMWRGVGAIRCWNAEHQGFWKGKHKDNRVVWRWKDIGKCVKSSWLEVWQYAHMTCVLHGSRANVSHRRWFVDSATLSRMRVVVWSVFLVHEVHGYFGPLVRLSSECGNMDVLLQYWSRNMEKERDASRNITNDRVWAELCLRCLCNPERDWDDDENTVHWCENVFWKYQFIYQNLFVQSCCQMPDQQQTNQTSGVTPISRDAGATWLGAVDANGTKQARNLEMQWTEKGHRCRRWGETATNGANVFPVVWSDINKWRQGKSLCD